jgi:DNA repair protein RadC
VKKTILINQNYYKMKRVNELELVYKRVRNGSSPQITTSQSAYDVLYMNWNLNTIDLKETFKILCLDRANNVIGIHTVSEGGVSGTVVDVKMIFSTALLANASGIILAHNHPSGSLIPSEPDKKITAKIKKAGDLLDIAVLDHLIITSTGFYSFADEGMIP